MLWNCIKWIGNIQRRVGREDSPALLCTDHIKSVLQVESLTLKARFRLGKGLVTECRWLKTKPGKTQEGGNWGSPVRAILSSMLNQPTNKHAHKQTASLSWSLCSRWQSLSAVSRTGSALSGLQYPGPASPAAPSVPGISLVLHCLVHSSPKHSSPPHKGYSLAEQLSSDHWHWAIIIR